MIYNLVRFRKPLKADLQETPPMLEWVRSTHIDYWRCKSHACYIQIPKKFDYHLRLLLGPANGDSNGARVLSWAEKKNVKY